MVSIKLAVLLVALVAVGYASAQVACTCDSNGQTLTCSSCNNGTCAVEGDTTQQGQFQGFCQCNPNFVDVVDSAQGTATSIPCAACAEGYQYVLNNGKGYCVRINPCNGVNCMNGGKCVPTTDGYKCECPFPYTGTRACTECLSGYTWNQDTSKCDPVANPCEPNPCIEFPNRDVCATPGPVCNCKPGFVPNPFSSSWGCIPIDSTRCPIDCGQHGICRNETSATTGAIRWFCQCEAGYVHAPTPATLNGFQFTWQKPCVECAEGYIRNIDGVCVRPTNPDPCADFNCGYGTCSNDGSDLNTCNCFTGFTTDTDGICTLCAEGYTDGPAIAGINTKCSECVAPLIKVNGRCVQPTAGPLPCPNCNNGICVNITTATGVTPICRCNEGYMNDPKGEFCSICVNPLGDATNGCAVPTSNNCDERCKQLDPNSFCVVRKDTAGNVVGYGCQCLPNFVKDQNGKCTLCHPAWYTVTTACDTPRCELPCQQGKCVVKRNDLGQLVYGCQCAEGWTGDLCDTPVSTPCDCPAPQICIKYEEMVNGQYVVFTKCGCKPGFEDYVDPKTGAVRPCGKCIEGKTGPNCDIDVVPNVPTCENVRCPANTHCQVYKVETSGQVTLQVGCFCDKDNSLFNPETNCGLTDVPTDPCAGIQCRDPNAICVPTSERPIRGRCECKKGYRRTELPTGEKICVPIQTDRPCDIQCGPRQVCVSAPIFTGDATTNVAYADKCICIPNSHPVEPTADVPVPGCECDFPWTGDRCEKFINFCERIAGTTLACPPRTKCVPTRERPFYECVCDGSNTGTDCQTDLCATVKCSGGQICNSKGQCVCPEPLVLIEGRCQDRKPISTGVNADDDATCGANDICHIAPIDRTLVDGANTDTEKGLQLVKNADGKEDTFDIKVIKEDGIGIRIRRMLKAGGRDILNFGVNFAFKGYRIKELPGTDPKAAGTVINTINFGSADYPVDTFTKEIVEKDGAKLIKVIAAIRGGIARAEFFFAEKEMAAEDNGVGPNTAFWLYGGVIPAEFYNGPQNKLCMFGQLKADANMMGSFVINEAERIANFFPLIEGVLSNAGPALGLEGKVNIGSANLANIKYSFTPNADGVEIEGCIEALMPDAWRLDPSGSVGSSFAQTTGSSATIAVSFVMILAALVAALLL